MVKDFHYESLREDIGSLGFFLGSSSGMLAVKLSAGDFSPAISKVEDLWNKFAPEQPFNYRFMDDSFNTTYEAEQRLGKIFIIFTVLSIFIACLGLFGLAAFNAQKRTKEIGVRKVMGATVGQIIQAYHRFFKISDYWNFNRIASGLVCHEQMAGKLLL